MTLTLDNMSEFYSLPLETRNIFYAISGKGDWTAEEAFEHLVPETLQDDNREVLAWMNGDKERGWPDRDCSRIEAGGDYSVDNTIMEDMSANRSRGDADMTDQELEEIKRQNDLDAQEIEDFFDEPETLLDSAEEVADATLIGEGAEIASGFLEVTADFIAPVIGGAVAAKAVADRCETTKDKLGYGSMAAGGTVVFLCSPIGQAAIGGYLLYKVGKRGHRMWQRHQERKAR